MIDDAAADLAALVGSDRCVVGLTVWAAAGLTCLLGGHVGVVVRKRSVVNSSA